MKEWKKIYEEKLRSTQEAAKLIDPGDVIFVGCTGCFAKDLVDQICLRPDLRGVALVGSTNAEDLPAVTDQDCFERMSYSTFFMGSGDRRNYPLGNVQVNSIHYHNFYRTIRDVYKINTLVMECSTPDEEGYLYYGTRGTCWASADQLARKIILQVNPQQQKVLGDHTKIHVSQVTALCWSDHPVRPYLSRPATASEERIAQHILPWIKNGDVLQIGIGSIPNTIARHLKDRRGLGIYSEVLTEGLLELIRAGAVDRSRIRASFALPANGSIDAELLPYIRLAPIDQINSIFQISKIPDLVSVNSCFMADLTGQVCSENYGSGQYSGMGGQVDFIRGAAESPGGRSFLAFSSTHVGKDGKVSSNVHMDLPRGAVVTTQRCDVMYLVTEWGIADLFNKPLEERAYEMINIAHPQFRMELYHEALAAGLIRPLAADPGRIVMDL